KIDALDDEIDECSSDPTCGDGVVDKNSDIDGDGNVERDEECDDGNDNHWDACQPDCEVNNKQLAWPTATIGDQSTTLKVNDGENVSVGVIKFGADWEKYHPNRETYETMAHEYAHNLGLSDLYGGDFARSFGNWNLMGLESRFTHLSLSQRMMLGWVDANQVVSFNPGDEESAEVLLSPIETLQTSGDQKLGVEIRLADGWNYYWEYRLGQSSQVADQQAPVPQSAPGVVLGTDHMSTPKNAGQKRRRIAKVPQGPESADFTLDQADIFRQADPSTSQELRVEVVDATSSQARVDLGYGTFVPDPAIREWPSDLGRWKSPDIEIVNEKNKPGSDGEDEWRNVPWANHKNTIIATVRNNGSEDAPGVTVRFYSQRFNAGENLPENLLGTVTKDVPAGSTVEFKLDGSDAWVPRGERHYCVKAEIDIYANPNTATPEATQMNNNARSNYTRYWSDSSSPAERKVGTLTVNNPTDERTVVGVMVDQTHPHFRTYIEHRWVTLDPGQSQDIRVMYEYARDFQAQLNEQVEYFPVNDVTLTGVVVPSNPQDDIDWANPDTMGGANAQIRAGYETELEFEQVPNANDQQSTLTGFVDQTRNDQPVTEGEVIVRVKHESRPDTYRRSDLDQNGKWEMVDVDVGDWEQVDAEYVGRFPNAPSENVAITP
ncbi:MAG: hypothetical protein ACQEVA_13000, partial [Myxococcota bacterium]